MTHQGGGGAGLTSTSGAAGSFHWDSYDFFIWFLSWFFSRLFGVVAACVLTRVLVSTPVCSRLFSVIHLNCNK